MEAKAMWAIIMGALVVLGAVAFGVHQHNVAENAELKASEAQAQVALKDAQVAEAQKSAEAQKRQAEEAVKAAEAARKVEEEKAKAASDQLAAIEAEKAAAKAEADAKTYRAYFEDSSDILEVGESLSAVKDVITSAELKTLTSGTISTSYGQTDYNQYLRFEESSGKVVFGENNDDVVGDFLYFEANEPIYEYELEFPSGLESAVEDGVLRDLDGRKVNVLGKDYTFVNSKYDSGSQRVELELLSGDNIITLREGETQKVKVGDVEHDVVLTFVSDPNTGSPEAKISVDGELTQALGEGETDILDSGLEVGVSEILTNSRESIVKMFFGAHKIVISDKITDDLYSSGADVDRERINYVDVSVKGTVDGSKVTISSIKYRVSADAADGSDIFIAPGHGLKEVTRRPIGLLSDKFDIKYDGLADVETTEFAVRPSGDERYTLEFTNRKGSEYSIDYVTTKNGIFKYGTDDEDLWFVEAGSSSTFVVARNDVAVLTDAPTDKGYTAVVRYEDIDTTDKILTFSDLGSKGGDIQVSYTGTEGVDAVGDLIVNGKTFKVYVGGGPDHKLAMDLTSDGNVDGTHAPIVINGGGIFHAGPATIVGTSFVTDFTTLEKNFDNLIGDEVFTLTFSKTPEDEVALDVSSGLDLFSVGDDDVGMSRFGSVIRVKDNDNGPDSFEMAYPVEQRKAEAYVFIG